MKYLVAENAISVAREFVDNGFKNFTNKVKLLSEIESNIAAVIETDKLILKLNNEAVVYPPDLLKSMGVI